MTKRRAWLSAGAALAGLMASTTAAAQAEPPQSRFALPAQPLGDALREVARQSGRNLVVANDLVANRTAPPLRGTMTAEEAVRQLLGGTSLRTRLVGDTIIVERAGSAEQSLAGPVAPTPDPGSDSVIVVTGTNLRGAPPTSPVIGISRREIERQAPASVEELIRKLPQNVASGVGQENFGVSGAGADITDHGAGINLRGLGQRATLTLVNGRRLAPGGTGAFVDLSLIPISAIDRIEVLTDGASAIYGSDAVGGVVNFLLRRDFSGLEATIQAGSSIEGGGEQLLAALAAGRQWSSGQALLAYEFRLEQEIKAGDRDFTIGLPDSWFLFPRERRHSLYGHVRQALAPALEAQVSGFAARRRTERSFAQGGAVTAVDAEAHASTVGGTAGFHWSFAPAWRAELSAGWSRTRSRQVQLGQADGVLVNRFNTENAVADIDLRLTGDLFTLPGGAAKLALGGQVRREHYRDRFETLVNSPSPTRARRTVRSAFGELLVPIVGEGNRRPGLHRLLVTGALRLDHYAAYGTSADPKLGLLWSPLSGLNLRGSYATSFRAPLLSETEGNYTAYYFPARLLYRQPSTAPAGVGAVLVGDDPDVRPETSRSWTLGADWLPPAIPGLSINASYYDIRFDNRIALPSRSIVVVGDPALEAIVTRTPDTGEVADLFASANQIIDFSGPGFTNGNATAADVVVLVDARTSNTASTRTRGIDVVARYAFETGPDQWRADLNLNRVLAFTDRLTATSPALERLNSPFNPLKWRGRASLGWQRGPLSANLFGHYVGAYRDRRTDDERRVRSWTTFDLGLAYDFRTGQERQRRALRLGLNVQNLFDTDPPRLEAEPAFGRDIGYDPVNASGRGRTISVQLRGSW